MEQWHKVRVYRGHVDTGRADGVIAFVYADGVNGVLRKYHMMPSVKKTIKRNFPNISPLSLEESVKLEEQITEEGRITLERARKTWYYSGDR